MSGSRLVVRDYAPADWPQVWCIVEAVVTAGETFTYDPFMGEQEAREMWTGVGMPGRVSVAVSDGLVRGTAVMGTNRPGPGSHVSTASFMVASSARARGVGTALCRDALRWARSSGYAGMQFNAVAASNAAALRLYQRAGLDIVGTVPGAFLHPLQGRVGLHVLYQELTDG